MESKKETPEEILHRLAAGKVSNWHIEARRRQKYRLYYDIKFKIQLEWIIFKKGLLAFFKRK